MNLRIDSQWSNVHCRQLGSGGLRFQILPSPYFFCLFTILFQISKFFISLLIIKFACIWREGRRQQTRVSQRRYTAAEGNGYFFISNVQSFIVLGVLNCEQLANNPIWHTSGGSTSIIQGQLNNLLPKIHNKERKY